jgi:hypothetical protein
MVLKTNPPPGARASMLRRMSSLTSWGLPEGSTPMTFKKWVHSISVVGAPLAGAQGRRKAYPYQPILNTPLRNYLGYDGFDCTAVKQAVLGRFPQKNLPSTGSSRPVRLMRRLPIYFLNRNYSAVPSGYGHTCRSERRLSGEAYRNQASGSVGNPLGLDTSLRSYSAGAGLTPLSSYS